MESEISPDEAPRADEDLFLCLLEDDALITGISVVADRLLRPGAAKSTVVLVIHVVPEEVLPTLGTVTWHR